MIDATRSWIVPWLAFLADWSVRWGLILAALALWFALRPPRRAATRHALCAAGLAAGLLLPLVPRWGYATIVWPAPAANTAPAAAAHRQSEPTEEPEANIASATRTSPDARWARPDLPNTPGYRQRASLPAPWRNASLLAAWAVAVAWAAITIILSIRLLGGWRLLARMRREARVVDESSRRLLGECRDALRLTRQVVLASHPAVASPVTIGGLRPLVLVPSDWDAWPESHRRDCLLHELAHLARRDDWAKMIQELVRIPLFFHPLVRWLLARLDREREILCDEAVVARGADPVAYARLLLALTQRPGRLTPAAATLPPGWLPILERSTVAVRIERLLEEDMSRPLPPPSPRRLLALGVVALVAALGAGSRRLPAVEAGERPRPGDTRTAGARTEPTKATLRSIKGVVLDPEGKPVSGAVIVAGVTNTGTPNHQALTTDGEGRFAWPIPAGSLSVSLFAHKAGRAPATWSRWLDAGKTGDEIELKLGQSGPFAAMLVDGEGRSLAQARVRVEMSAQNDVSPRGIDGATIQTVLTYYHRDVLGGSPLEPLFVATTDGQGAFSFPSVCPNAWLRLAVTTQDGRAMRVKGRTIPAGSLGRMMDEQGFVAASPGQETRLVAVPAAKVEGRVVTKLPEVSVSGLRIWFQGSRVQTEAPLHPSNFTGEARTDTQGRFALDGLDEGAINILIEGGGPEVGWTYRAAENVSLRAGRTDAVTIELIRGVETEGKVLAQGSGLPLKGVMIGVHGPYRPRSGAATSSATTDAEGRYRFRLPAGECYFYVMGTDTGIAVDSGHRPSRSVIIPEDVARFAIPPIMLAPK